MRSSPEDFIRAWQTSLTVKECAEKLGMTESSCYARSAFYRRKGINLKDMKRRKLKDSDIDALKKLAESLNGETDSS